MNHAVQSTAWNYKLGPQDWTVEIMLSKRLNENLRRFFVTSFKQVLETSMIYVSGPKDKPGTMEKEGENFLNERIFDSQVR